MRLDQSQHQRTPQDCSAVTAKLFGEFFSLTSHLVRTAESCSIPRTIDLTLHRLGFHRLTLSPRANKGAKDALRLRWIRQRTTSFNGGSRMPFGFQSRDKR